MLLKIDSWMPNPLGSIEVGKIDLITTYSGIVIINNTRIRVLTCQPVTMVESMEPSHLSSSQY
jgi:hypothetical protein